MAEGQKLTCWECVPPTEWEPQQFNGHQNKHRRERKKAATAADSSSIPLDEKTKEDGEPAKPFDFADTPPPKLIRPKVATGLVPWLSLMGLAVQRRNAYDGNVIACGIPNFVEALDEVAQENDALYRLLEGIQAGNSPNFKLAVATLGILIPILANHRPDSGMLRNAVGALRIMPGTNIPALPKPQDMDQTLYDVSEQMTQKMRDTLENMTEEERQQVEDAFKQVPDDLLQKMANFQTSPSMMDHPEAETATVPETDSGDETSGD